MEMKFNTIPEILEEIKKGKVVIMLDDYDRENEGDFVMASDFVTSETINFMALYGRGLICTPIEKKLADKLAFSPMIEKNSATHETAFTVTVDAKENITTGISASDRAYTIKLMMNNQAKASDFARPGHVFPLIAKDGGVLIRRGHTEAAVDLAKLAGCNPSGVICEILKEDGSLARGLELFEVAKRFNLKIGNIQDLVEFIENKESNKSIQLVSSTKFPNKFGLDFKISMFKNMNSNEDLMAITLGDDFSHEDTTLVRIHSECFTGDVFGSLRCDCGEQLEHAMKKIVENGSGIVLYLKQEGRGIGLSEKLKSYELQELGFDTIEANIKLGHPIDSRNYEFAIDVLEKLNVSKVSLLSNNPDKINAFKNSKITVTQIALETIANPYNQFYLQTKKEKLGHTIQ
jgi:3,4-dihydroxy 2-butanone 4-phosphate synthase/GTP cyclohydrolase II